MTSADASNLWNSPPAEVRGSIFTWAYRRRKRHVHHHGGDRSSPTLWLMECES